jgi:hypothetical protein
MVNAAREMRYCLARVFSIAGRQCGITALGKTS